jgi:hypothetical protein
MKRGFTRHADPYRDTELIDERAPRANQLVVGALSLVAVTVGPWWLLALLAAQLAVGLGVLSAASLAFVAGLETAGTALGVLVAVLALLAATTGFCAGCTAYKLGYRLTGRTFVACPLPPSSLGPTDAG